MFRFLSFSSEVRGVGPTRNSYSFRACRACKRAMRNCVYSRDDVTVNAWRSKLEKVPRAPRPSVRVRSRALPLACRPVPSPPVASRCFLLLYHEFVPL